MEPRHLPGLRRHSLSIFLVCLLAAQTALWALLKLAGPVWDRWLGEYLLSILADTYGALLLVLATKWLIEQGSAESKE